MGNDTGAIREVFTCLRVRDAADAMQRRYDALFE